MASTNQVLMLASIVLASFVTPTIVLAADGETKSKQAEIQPGDSLTVIVDSTRLMLGEKVVAVLPNGTEVRAGKIQGDWIGCRVTIGGKEESGWVQRSEVAARAAGPRRPETGDAKPDTPSETIASNPPISKPGHLVAIQPPGGAPLVLWIGRHGTELNAGVLGKTNKRMESVPKEDLIKWLLELDRLIDDKVSSSAGRAECILWFVNRLSVAFDDDKWNSPRAAKLFTRAESMSAADVKLWQAAFKELLKQEIGKTYAIPLVLIPVDRLYSGDKYQSESARKYLARLGQVTLSDVSFWKKEVDEFGGTDLDAAINIVLLDEFFENELFQREKLMSFAEADRN